MGKHNGKTRRTGLRVGTALANRHKQGTKGGSGAGQSRHTTDTHGPGQSILERSDLDELMAMADLADRDFAAEKAQVIVVSTGTVDPQDEERGRELRAEAEGRLADRLKIPRRPAWTHETTPDQLDAQERSMFLEWRRGLAEVEAEERLVLTPFERNLDVWRQLWRVVERSDVVCQVVDARDPLLYWSDDLVRFCREVSPSKASYMLLNKADLLPPHIRRMWADHLDSLGVGYVFWSAAASMVAQQKAKQEAALGLEGEPAGKGGRGQGGEEEVEERIRVLDAEELLLWMEGKALLAIQDAQSESSDSEEEDEDEDEEEGSGPRRAEGEAPDRRVMVGLVGYPNVGKSSTINALFGTKKAAMGPTPGKTKHFQTLIMSPTLCLCDCPGLVFPRFAASKADMVAAGVIPIDRLTEMRTPCDVVTARCGRWQLEAAYNIRLKGLAPADGPKPSEGPLGPPTAAEVLGAIALTRGWTCGGGLPDEVRAGRLLLKDYTAGKVLYCVLPPGSERPGWIPGPQEVAARRAAVWVGEAEDEGADSEEEDSSGSEVESGGELDGEVGEVADEEGDEASARSGQEVPSSSEDGRSAGGQQAGGPALDKADLELMAALGMGGGKQKKVRAEHKFHKKAARSKGNRGQWQDGGGYDGAALATGKKGGLDRVVRQMVAGGAGLRNKAGWEGRSGAGWLKMSADGGREGVEWCALQGDCSQVCCPSRSAAAAGLARYYSWLLPVPPVSLHVSVFCDGVALLLLWKKAQLCRHCCKRQGCMGESASSVITAALQVSRLACATNV